MQRRFSHARSAGIVTTARDSALRATYRLQIHAGFPTTAAARLVPYLARLGISHVYSSPLLKARAGSPHGYDVVDPTIACPERGGEAGLAALHRALVEHEMGLVLDIVPNHMGTGAENPRWDDLLTHGQASRFARWFDVDWDAGAGRLVLPVLGTALGAVLAGGEIVLGRDPARGFRLRYFEHDFPVDPATAAGLVARAARRIGGAPATDLAAAAAELRALPPRTSSARDRDARTRRAMARLAGVARGPDAGRALEAEVAALATTGRRRLRALLDAQAYRLVHWRRGGRLVNYRRFFNVADLAAVRVEDDAVFDATHALVLEWVAAGLVDGLRIDHVDGLWDPRGYLERLRDVTAAARPSRPTPIWVEKILCGAEPLRPDWPVAGTTGYELLNALEAVLIDPAGYAHIDAWYRRTTAGGPRRLDLAAIVAGAKRRVLGTWLAADVTRLARGLPALLAVAGGPGDATVRDAERAIVETIVGLPVYRTYAPPDGRPLDPVDRRLARTAVGTARGAGRARPDVLDGLGRVLAGDVPAPSAAAARCFTAALQQLSPPAMAKGFEDTALYAFVALASRNEVGGDPGRALDDAPAALHAANAERAARWPDTLLATSTHDTKRSADLRARLDALSEMAAAWTRTVGRWRRHNRRHRSRVRGRLLPDDNTEYLLYQSLVGLWPGDARPAAPRAGLAERLAAYALKAAREAKVHTSWLAPDPRFESALLAFLAGVLADEGFVDEVDALVRPVARAGLWNGLARTLVHLTAPGVPDVYQGDEIWTLALADPDNRRPVDFAARARLLETVAGDAWPPGLLERPDDGRVKLLVVARALAARRRSPATFARGTYEALGTAGPSAPHVFAFARRHAGDVCATIVPRLTYALATGAAPVGASVWSDTVVALPPLRGRVATDLLTHERHTVPPDGRLPLARVLRALPVALLWGEP